MGPFSSAGHEPAEKLALPPTSDSSGHPSLTPTFDSSEVSASFRASPISFPPLEPIDESQSTVIPSQCRVKSNAPSGLGRRYGDRAVRQSTANWTSEALDRQAADLDRQRRRAIVKSAPIVPPSPIREQGFSGSPSGGISEEDAPYTSFTGTPIKVNRDSFISIGEQCERGAAFAAMQLDHGLEYQVALTSWIDAEEICLFSFSGADFHVSLRADSDGAPASHKQAMEAGEPWPSAEKKELDNHSTNRSWSMIDRSELPHGRRVHKLVWVYKLKRDGSAKARLCVQGCTLEAGVDYDQTFSQTLRHSSVRSLFALACRLGCAVRSIDYVAAYLQGDFIKGEVIYCRMPDGYVEKDGAGNDYLLRIEKPIYGIPQAGRRLQRKAFPWLIDAGLTQCTSDDCIFVRRDKDSDEVFVLGIYVDNLQIVHSAEMDEDGDVLDKSIGFHGVVSTCQHSCT